MRINKVWRHQGRSPLLLAMATTAALFTSGAAQPPGVIAPEPLVQIADITIQVPVIMPHYPVIVVPRQDTRERREVTVQFIAEGDDWATIYLDDRLLFRANNTRRNHTVTLEPGAYHLAITGVSRFDVWDAGYLDIGRNDTNLVVIRYGKESGIRSAGDPYVWIPE